MFPVRGQQPLMIVDGTPHAAADGLGGDRFNEGGQHVVPRGAGDQPVKFHVALHGRVVVDGRSIDRLTRTLEDQFRRLQLLGD